MNTSTLRKMVREYPAIGYATRGIVERFREDIVASAALALAEAQAAGVPDADILRTCQHAARRTQRRERAWDKRVSFTTREVQRKVTSEYADLWNAMNDLPRRQIAVVVMRFWEGMSNAEVAAEIGATEKAVERVVERAYAGIRSNLQKGGVHVRTH